MNDIVFAAYRPCDFTFKNARSPRELDGFWNLRRRVFCEEQRLFDVSDRDTHDATMIPIVAKSILAGMEDEIVGAVRIDQREPGVWWGSRLCVRDDYRRLGRLGKSVGVRNDHPERRCRSSIGAGLIFKAVSSAHALGCRTFLAHVQRPNAAFFSRLHWETLRDVDVHGMPHVEMQADLAFYPPARRDLSRRRVA